MLNYLRYFGTHVLLLVTMAGLLAGGGWYWAGLAAGVVIWIGGDAFSLPVGPTPRYRHEIVLDLALYSLFPPLVALAVLYAWTLSPGDLFGIGAWASRASFTPIMQRAACRGVTCVPRMTDQMAAMRWWFTRGAP